MRTIRPLLHLVESSLPPRLVPGPGSRVPYNGVTMIPAALIARLQEIVGPAHVLVRPEDVVVYEQDAFLVAHSLPDLVVLPGSTEEVAAVVGAAGEAGVPIVARGAGRRWAPQPRQLHPMDCFTPPTPAVSRYRPSEATSATMREGP